MASPDSFRQAVETFDPEAIFATLAEDVVFNSPVVFKLYEGREAVSMILSAVTQVFEDFRYLHEFHGDGEAALIFAARVGDRELQGLDLIEYDDAGLVKKLTVMVRPMSGMHALAEAMRAKLEAAA